jgi:hypothetical protein
MKRSKPRTRGSVAQDPRQYRTPAAKHQAECVAAIDGLLRYGRRCGRAFGSDCTQQLVDLLVAELGGAGG